MTEPHPHPQRRRGLFGTLRASFLTGLVVVLPVGLTIYLIWTVVGWIDGWVLPFVPQSFQPPELIQHYLCAPVTDPAAIDVPFYCETDGINIRGVGVVIFLIFTIFIGWVGKGIIGRSIIGYAEVLVDRTPIVRSIYNGIKQIAETVFAQSDTNFDKSCLVEYPKENIWAIGFVSTKARGELSDKLSHFGEILSVFVPTTPNPTSGFLLYVPAKDVIMLDMKIEDAAKLIISAGLVYPNAKDPTQPPAPNGNSGK